MIHYITTNGIGNAWIAEELAVMRSKGIPFVLHSLRKPHQTFYAGGSAWQIHEHTRFLYPLSPGAFLVSLCIAPFVFRARYAATLWNAFTGPRESLTVRLKALIHLLVACHWARGLRHDGVTRIHAHWVHSAGTVGMYAAWLLNRPFSFTGHAVDLFRDRVALADKVRRADLIVCISTFHREFYRSEFNADPGKLLMVYCGIDVGKFGYRPPRQRSTSARILSVGRLVEKKGFADLIDACRILADRGVEFECVVAGSGPLESALRRQIDHHGLGERVQVTGEAVLQEDLATLLAQFDVFAQPCVWSSDGDVDGTPRTLMEAMATGLPVVATRITGIPDVVEEGKSGLLVEAGSPASLADALQRVLGDRELACLLSSGGRERIESKFEINADLEPLVRRFREDLRSGEGAR